MGRVRVMSRLRSILEVGWGKHRGMVRYTVRVSSGSMVMDRGWGIGKGRNKIRYRVGEE